MNKKLLTHLLPVLLTVALVSAIYVVQTITLDVGVEEPFVVEYAMLGDGGDYDPETDGYCKEVTTWFTAEQISEYPTGNMFPGESRKLCIKVANKGEADIDYTVTSKIQTGHSNYATCSLAFPETSIGGIAVGSETEGNTGELGVTVNGHEFTVPQDAPEVENCLIDISTARG